MKAGTVPGGKAALTVASAAAHHVIALTEHHIGWGIAGAAGELPSGCYLPAAGLDADGGVGRTPFS